ncbi:MAG: two-component regulator propeller domain-containing protein [Bacteroidota bacterium]
MLSPNFSSKLQIIFLLTLGFLPLILQAQVYNISSYTTSEGLIQSQVRSIVQDNRGFLWFGTQRGISRYDGKSFLNFDKKKGLESDFIACIYEDVEGLFWLGTNQGLYQFNGRTFTSWGGKIDQLSKQILSITQSADSLIWIGTQDQGLIIIDPNKDSVLLNHPAINGLSAKLSVQALYTSSDDQIWIGTDQGVFLYDGTSISGSALPLSISVFNFLEDSRGDMWIGTEKGAFQIGKRILQQLTLADGLPNEKVYCVLEDQDGQIWMGTGQGVVRLKGDELIPFEKEDFRLAVRMRSALTDHEGNIWFGTDGGGVIKVTKGVFETYNMAAGMSSSIAKSFLEDEKGRMWISTFDQGISILQDRSFSFLNEQQGLGGNDISYSLKDSQGNFWFCFYENGLTRYQDEVLTRFQQHNGLVSNTVYCLAEAPNGDMWAGTNQGISIINKEGIQSFPLNDSLIDKSVYAILHDSKGNSWIGTPLGLTVLSAEGIRSFKAPDEIGATIITILEDGKGWIWFATANGIYIQQEEKLVRLGISEASGANRVVSMVFDGEDYLWIGTFNGAYRLKLVDFYGLDYQEGQKVGFEHYTGKDGLPNLECNANAAFRDSQGNIWLGTVAGAIKQPAGLERVENTPAPRVFITAVRSSEVEDWEKDNYELDTRSGLPLSPLLPSGEDRIDFEFIGISYKSSKQIEYKYRLTGLDDWSRPTRQTSVAYTNLDAGEYAFEVVAKKESEKWNYDKPARFEFNIKKPIYATGWFRILASLALLGLGTLIYLQVTSDRKRKREEQRIKDKAEKLQLEHQALYAMMNPHFTFNALQSIQYFIHRQDKVSANKFLSSFAKLIRKNLESTRSEFISLAEEVDRLNLYLSLENMRFPEKFDYEVKVDPSIDKHDTLLPPMILQPFVENSIKHGIMPLEGGGKVKVHIKAKDEDYLLIHITDNGIGIEQSKLQKKDRPKDHVSRGMQITMDRLALFGRITAKEHGVEIGEKVAADGKILGTEVKLMLPRHLSI